MTITFGGAPFAIPVPIGAGIGAMIEQQIAELKREKLAKYEEPVQRAQLQALARQAAEEVLTSEESKHLPGVRTYILNKIIPALPDAWKSVWLQQNYPYDYTLILLNNLLTAESEVTVEQAFRLAGKGEVEVLRDFFTEKLADSPSPAPDKTKPLQSSKGTRKPRH